MRFRLVRYLYMPGSSSRRLTRLFCGDPALWFVTWVWQRAAEQGEGDMSSGGSGQPLHIRHQARPTLCPSPVTLDIEICLISFYSSFLKIGIFIFIFIFIFGIPIVAIDQGLRSLVRPSFPARLVFHDHRPQEEGGRVSSERRTKASS